MSRITISALIHLINQENFAGSPCISVEKSSVERSNNRGMLMSVFHDWLLRIASEITFSISNDCLLMILAQLVDTK